MPKRKLKQYTIDQAKLAISLAFPQGNSKNRTLTFRQITDQSGVPHTTISRWVKDNCVPFPIELLPATREQDGHAEVSQSDQDQKQAVLSPAAAYRNRSSVSPNVRRSPTHFSCYLSLKEEKTLVHKILQFSEMSYSMSYQQIMYTATLMVKAKGIAFRGKAQRVSYHWLRLFLDRHPELKVTKQQVLDQRRKKALNEDNIRDYYAFLEQLIKDKRVCIHLER